MKLFFQRVAPLLPFSALVRLSGVNVVMPFYHLVSDNAPAHVKHLYPVCRVGEFKAHLQFMLKHFTPVSASDLVRIASTGESSSKPYLYLSFDDGFRELSDIVAPILTSSGVPATFFVNTGFVDNKELFYRCKVSLIADAVLSSSVLQKEYNIADLLALRYPDADAINSIAQRIGINFDEYLSLHRPYMDYADLNRMQQQGFTIGGHSHSHPDFSYLSTEEQVLEVVRCMSWINAHFPNQPQLFSFPFSDIGVEANVFDLVQAQGKPIVNLFFGTSGIKPGKHPLHLQRIPMEYSHKSAQKVLAGELFYYLVKRLMRLT